MNCLNQLGFKYFPEANNIYSGNSLLDEKKCVWSGGNECIWIRNLQAVVMNAAVWWPHLGQKSLAQLIKHICTLKKYTFPQPCTGQYTFNIFAHKH